MPGVHAYPHLQHVQEHVDPLSQFTAYAARNIHVVKFKAMYTILAEIIPRSWKVVMAKRVPQRCISDGNRLKKIHIRGCMLRA